MLFRNRKLFVRLGRLEVFAEDWQRLQGEKLIDIQRTEDEQGSTLQLWMPGVHLTVCLNGQRAGGQNAIELYHRCLITE